MLVVPVFAYANLLCAGGGAAFEACEDHEADDTTESAHHDHTPAQKPKDCSKDSCFCITMNTVVTQQTVTQPNHGPVFRALNFAVVPVVDVTPVRRLILAYEHGPPAIAPPAYLHAKTLSPRSPPLGA